VYDDYCPYMCGTSTCFYQNRIYTEDSCCINDINTNQANLVRPGKVEMVDPINSASKMKEIGNIVLN
jgi:hypothetical protein